MSVGLLERLLKRIQEHVGAEASRRDIASAQKMARRILYIQFMDPAAYPPLEHSSRLLADRGWEVLFLGTVTRGEPPLRLPTHPGTRIKNIRFVPRRLETKGSIHIILFCDIILDVVVEA